ncbi:MAG TPA: STAS domain-containing protein, partial [Terriglobales bacterium]
CMNAQRPRVVLDCSLASDMDRHSIYLLLLCLEAAMKRNGDVRLAGVSPTGWKNLEAAGASQLFRSFETCEQAIESYQYPPVLLFTPVEIDQAAANAA